MVLIAADEAGHYAVFSQAILAEWKLHEGSFARRWRFHMVSTKRMRSLGDVRDDAFREKVLACASPNSKRKAQAMEKDVHLLEAALCADRIVISCDEDVRPLFRNACGEVREIREICWANPDIEEEAVAYWVRAGALAEAQRQLGYSTQRTKERP